MLAVKPWAVGDYESLVVRSTHLVSVFFLIPNLFCKAREYTKSPNTEGSKDREIFTISSRECNNCRSAKGDFAL